MGQQSTKEFERLTKERTTQTLEEWFLQTKDEEVCNATQQMRIDTDILKRLTFAQQELGGTTVKSFQRNDRLGSIWSSKFSYEISDDVIQELIPSKSAHNLVLDTSLHPNTRQERQSDPFPGLRCDSFNDVYDFLSDQRRASGPDASRRLVCYMVLGMLQQDYGIQSKPDASKFFGSVSSQFSMQSVRGVSSRKVIDNLVQWAAIGVQLSQLAEDVEEFAAIIALPDDITISK
jgi:hypothetical protein